MPNLFHSEINHNMIFKFEKSLNRMNYFWKITFSQLHTMNQNLNKPISIAVCITKRSDPLKSISDYLLSFPFYPETYIDRLLYTSQKQQHIQDIKNYNLIFPFTKKCENYRIDNVSSFSVFSFSFLQRIFNAIFLVM